MFVLWEAEDISPEGIESIAAMAEITVEIGLGFGRTGGRYVVDLVRSNPEVPLRLRLVQAPISRGYFPKNGFIHGISLDAKYTAKQGNCNQQTPQNSK